MNPVKPEFRSKLLKGIGTGLLTAIVAYSAVKGGEKLYDKWINDHVGPSVAEWFETYTPTK